MSRVGDLGRRVARRREELGISRDEVATRASMHPSFVELIEESPAPRLTTGALRRLASALDTTVDALSGGGMLAPPGRSVPPAGARTVQLDPETCRQRIEPGGVGRVVFGSPRGSVAVPVNFKVLNGDIVFRTDAAAEVVEAVRRGPVSFEVDHLDDALREGWSVLVSGTGRVVDGDAELESVRTLGITPWAGGTKDRYVRITPSVITGREIRHP